MAARRRRFTDKLAESFEFGQHGFIQFRNDQSDIRWTFAGIQVSTYVHNKHLKQASLVKLLQLLVAINAVFSATDTPAADLCCSYAGS